MLKKTLSDCQKKLYFAKSLISNQRPNSTTEYSHQIKKKHLNSIMEFQIQIF